jgi:DNA-binding transcriptional MerR regulator
MDGVTMPRGRVSSALTPLRLAEVAKLTGFTTNQLRYFEVVGLLHPSLVGLQRVYGPRELDEIAVIKSLHDRGYRPKQILAILENEARIPTRRAAGVRSPVTARDGELMAKASDFWTSAEEFLERRKPFEVPVGPEFQTYNTAYRRLRQLAARRKRRVRLMKRGEKLLVEPG